MKQIILIGLCILFLLVGCNKIDTFIEQNNSIWETNISFSTCLNVTVLPMKEFCDEINMTYFRGLFFKDSGCIDSDGEIHYYKISFDESSGWTIGNKFYSPEWRCI